MIPTLDQVFSAHYGMKTYFEKEVEALQRYASRPDAKQSYIDQRNRQLEKIASAIGIIESYIDSSQMLYYQGIRLKNTISYDTEFRVAYIIVKVRDGDPKGRIVLID